jgi:hypothetical protein
MSHVKDKKVSFADSRTTSTEKAITNGIIDYGYYGIKLVNTVEKFDSGASACMSGQDNRLTNTVPLHNNTVRISGFNGSQSSPSVVGLNRDGKKEYFVPNMPKDLVLLCANAYASEGAAILHADGGVVIKLSNLELKELLDSIKEFPVVKRLKVNNRTYEIDNTDAYTTTQPSEGVHGCMAEAVCHTLYTQPIDQSDSVEVAMTNTANRYFNTRVNVSNTTERILTLLLTGLSFNDWYHHVQNNSLNGIPPDVNIQVLNNFERKYGRTPDIIRLARPIKSKNYQGLMDEPLATKNVGDRIEMDVMFPDFNDIFNVNTEDRQVKKIRTFGNAYAAAVSVDCHTGYVHGRLLDTLKRPLNYVKHFVETYETEGVTVKLIAADAGIIPRAMFNVVTPEVQEYLRYKHIKTEQAEPHNHSRGTGTVEVNIRYIKELINMATTYVLRNQNIFQLGFTLEHILKLWGEVFLWAIVITNLKISPLDKTKSKYELYKHTKPNMQNIRLLPIFSVLMVYSETPKPYMNKPQWLPALYVGPIEGTPGAIRAAILTPSQKRLVVIPTSRFTAASEGGGLVVHHDIMHHLQKFIEDTQPPEETTKKDDSNEEEEDTEDQSATPSERKRRSKKAQTIVPTPRPVTEWTKNGEATVRRSARLSEKSHRISAFFADWTNHNEEETYYSFSDNQFYELQEFNPDVKVVSEDGFRAVTENIPKTFSDALKDPVWGDAARAELQTLLDTKAIVRVSKEYAQDAIRNQQADLLLLFPVFETKMRDGVQVYKVRLVGDGRTHYHAGNTYSATPSREELLILIHLVATLKWHCVHIDEKRAFLNAPHNGDHGAFAKFRNDNDQYFEVKGALYGMKTAPRDYQELVAQRLAKMGYKRLTMCSCMYYKHGLQGDRCIVFSFVDDFIYASDNKTLLESCIQEFRDIAPTTEPIWDPPCILGIQLKRDYEKSTIQCSMEQKITEVCDEYQINLNGRQKKVPMPDSGYIVKDEDYMGRSVTDAQYLNAKDIKKYMGIVGSLVWISGIRLDILFPVMYLTWFTKAPRQHHMNMAIYVLTYLGHTKSLPLVLGGPRADSATSNTTDLIGYSDASLGTAPKGRSCTGHIVKLSENAGAIMAKAKTTNCVVTSSFEGELDGATTTIKTMKRIRNILTELNISVTESTATFYSDNKAMIEFVNGQGVAKGVRHMELRMWYVREQIMSGDTKALHMLGKNIPADKLTKLAQSSEFEVYCRDIMGHSLL